MKVLPLFKSHYSLGRSILTLEKAEDSEENAPDSIIDLCLANGIQQLHLIDDSFSGFLEAYKNCEAAKVQLVFGLRMTFCKNIEDRSEESLATNCKFLIKSKTNEGYKRLIKIFSTACNKDVFYYEPRMDFKTLQKFWSDDDLELCVPFYDSFLYRNSLTLAVCVPDFSFTKPTFYIEQNDMPFDSILRKRVEEYTADKYDVVPTKSIYYAKRKDFKAYLTFRCINNRSTLDKPELEHMTSSEFCLESWKEQNEKGI